MAHHQPPNAQAPTQLENNFLNLENIYPKNNISSSFPPSQEFVEFSACKREEQRQNAFLPDEQASAQNHALFGGIDFSCFGDEEFEEMLGQDLKAWLNTDYSIVTKPIISSFDNMNNICDIKNNSSVEAKLSQATESTCNEEPSSPLMDGEYLNSLPDSKRQKRILANRQSAQRSRVRKLHYITDLEGKVATLQNEVSSLTPRVTYFDHQRSMLAISNGNLKQRVAALAEEKKFKEADHDSLRKELETLTLLREQKITKENADPVPESERHGLAVEREAQPQS